MRQGLALGCFLAMAATVPSIVHSKRTSAAAVPHEIVIQFHAGVSAADQADARAWIDASRKRALRSNRDGPVEVVTVASRGVEDAIALLQHHPAVQFAEPNYIYTQQAQANDARYISGEMYGMYSDDTPISYGPPGTTNAFGSHAEEAWGLGFTGSSAIVVGVIDTGIDLNHLDLVTNRWVNPFETLNGIDDDGNGFIDDINGWDFVNNDNNPFDDNGHGTHVAGTIGAIGNNGIGVVGVNWTVKLMALKFLNASGSGTLADAIEAIDYATDMKQRHNIGLVATNNSWGGGPFSTALRNAIIAGANEDILFVTTAGGGSSNNDVTPVYPANYTTLPEAGYDAVIAVAAIDSVGNKASFSNYGPTTVDLGASGVNIVSTVPSNSYAFFSGTSMATPHVTGAAALVASAMPLTASDIREAILDNTTPTPSLAGITVTGGRLNVAKALSGPGGQLPNLITKKIVVPATAKAGQTITITTKTKNLGPGNAPPSQTFIYFSNNATLDAGDPQVGVRAVPALAPLTASKGPAQVTIPPGTPNGTRYFFVKSDGPGVITETKEDDNVKQKAIAIVP